MAVEGDFRDPLPDNGVRGPDVALQLDLDQAAAGAQWLAHLGWRHTGDPAGFRPYRNPWYGGVGVQRALSPAWELGAGIDWREPIGRLGPLGEATVHLTLDGQSQLGAIAAVLSDQKKYAKKLPSTLHFSQELSQRRPGGLGEGAEGAGQKDGQREERAQGRTHG